MMKLLLIASIICLLYSFNFNVSAEQLTFDTDKKNGLMTFDYLWKDDQEQQHTLNFTLPLTEVNKKHHKKFIPRLADQYVYIELHKAARNIDPKEASVKIGRQGKDIKIQVNSRSQKLINKWHSAMEQSREKAFQRYLKDNYLSRLRSHLGQNVIKPDHLRYIAESKTPLLPIAKALYEKVPEKSETRVYVNLLLSWVQSIPYSPLDDRTTSNGAGYLPPPLVIANNIGDCDSKSALTASLIRSLLPGAKMVMIYLPNHALLGISLPFRTSERTLRIEGVDYLLMEPTGPANMRLGEISDLSEGAISGNMHSYEVVP